MSGNSTPTSNTRKRRHGTQEQSPNSHTPKNIRLDGAMAWGTEEEKNFEDKLYTRLMAGMKALLENNATKEDIEGVKKEILSEVKLDICALSDKVGAVATDNEGIKCDLRKLKQVNTALQKQIDEIERKARADRLVIKGLKINDINNIVQEAQDLLSALSGMDVQLKEAYQIPNSQDTGLPPHVLVQVTKESCIPAILKSNPHSKANTRMTRIQITRDMALPARVRNSRMLRLRHQIRTRAPTCKSKIIIAYDKMKVDGKILEWIGDELVHGEECGKAFLKRLTGYDFASEIEDIIRNKTNKQR